MAGSEGKSLFDSLKRINVASKAINLVGFGGFFNGRRAWIRSSHVDRWWTSRATRSSFSFRPLKAFKGVLKGF